MQTSQSKQHRPLILYVDCSEESAAVEQALQNEDVEFRVVYADGILAPLPAIATQYGVVRGLSNIRRYLLPNVKSDT